MVLQSLGKLRVWWFMVPVRKSKTIRCVTVAKKEAFRSLSPSHQNWRNTSCLSAKNLKSQKTRSFSSQTQRLGTKTFQLEHVRACVTTSPSVGCCPVFQSSLELSSQLIDDNCQLSSQIGLQEIFTSAFGYWGWLSCWSGAIRSSEAR